MNMLKLIPPRWPFDALVPVMGQTQVQAHYMKHYAGYVEKANAIVRRGGNPFEYPGYRFNRDGALLHGLFFEGLVPVRPPHHPPRALLQRMRWRFGTLRKAMVEIGSQVEGSGWVCLSLYEDLFDVHAVKNHDYPWELGRCGAAPGGRRVIKLVLALALFFGTGPCSYCNERPREQDDLCEGCFLHLVPPEGGVEKG
jgi:superoxide dismutase